MLYVGSKKPISSQVDFDQEELIILVSKTFGRKKVIESHLLPYSSSNKTLKITFDDGTSVVVKASIRESRFERILMESNLIKRLKEKSDLPLPDVLYTDFTRERFQYPYVIYSFVGGANLVDVIANIKNKKQIGTELAKVAFQIQCNKYNAPRFSIAKSPKSDSWVNVVKDVCSIGIKSLKERDYSNIVYVEKYIKNRIELIKEPSSFSLIHRDLQPQNIHWDVQNNKIAGVFDFEAAMSGDRIFEFTYLEMRLFKEYPEIRHSFYETYSKYVPLESNIDQILEFYGVVRDLIYYPRNISYGEPDRAETALKSIESVIFND